jgi:SAM-dependent methyltransferase
MQKETDNWFASWFDTPYYHILYKERDDNEAELFMNSLTSFLKLPRKAEILDLACGKGRHAIYLNQLGYDVTGIDLSAASIAFAKKFETDKLHFAIHDMSIPYPKEFDAVFNLFTSFGYFEDEEDNLKTIRAIHSELKPSGFGVIDFLNANFIKENLVPSETKTIEGITFSIDRYIKDGYIIKDIKFRDNNKDHFYTERVKAITLDDFKEYFEKAGVRLLHCFGDHHLNEFNTETSERLILIFH